VGGDCRPRPDLVEQRVYDLAQLALGVEELGRLEMQPRF
jgi:hypothetical protein